MYLTLSSGYYNLTLSSVYYISAPRIFLWWGGSAEPKAMYNLCLILNTSMKIMSKSPIQLLVRLQGKLKVTEKEKNLHILKCLLYFSVFQCTSLQVISVADLG